MPTTRLRQRRHRPRRRPPRPRRRRPRRRRRLRRRRPRARRRRRPLRTPRPPRPRPSAPAAAPDVPTRREDPLAEYRAKRDPARTAEPVPAAGSALPVGNDDTFVVQEHHTPRGRTGERVHWDLRLERDGVLKSWAVPKGPPTEPGPNRLAVPTEDHPLEYASFSGTISAGEYGGGEVSIWDAGRYTCEKWDDRHIIVTFDGRRLAGRYAL